MDKILVGLKRVVDYNVRVRVRSDGSGVETEGVKMSINPFDEIALEEALRVKERGAANEIVVYHPGENDERTNVIRGFPKEHSSVATVKMQKIDFPVVVFVTYLGLV